MKSMIINIDEAMDLVNQISQFDPVSMESIICMLIDTESAMYKEPAISILERICDAVKAVNEILGPYSARQGEDHDHKN